MSISIDHADGAVASRPATRQVELSARTIEYEVSQVELLSCLVH